MGVSGRVSSVVAAICIFIYIAAIAFGAVKVIWDLGERRNLAQMEFNDLTDRASSSAVFLGFMSEAYQETLRDFLAASKTLLGIIITGSGGEYAFERETGSGIVWAGDSPRFKTTPEFLGKPFFLPLRIDGQRNVTIQANYSYIDPHLLVSTLRNTLIAVLAALAIAFITLLIEYSMKSEAKKFSSVPAEKTPGSKAERVPEANYDSPEAMKPKGLFTSRGNVGWESYTEDRLTSELHRCASFEQDLTLLCIKFRKDAEIINSTLYRQFTDEAVRFFTMRDLIFELGDNGISVIIPSVNLEQGLAKSEEFRERIFSKLPESFEGRKDLCVGLSSRAGRLIEANRLILESSTALKKAMADPVSNVVAFKSDPEKYREFLKGR
jgi:hypothetical protein